MRDLTEGPLLRAIVSGTWMDPETGRPLACPIRAIKVAESLDGADADLIVSLDLGDCIAVVADGATWSALGRRVCCNLRRAATIDAVVLREPHADAETVAVVLERCRHATGLLAVGSGVINDLCKAAAAKSGRSYRRLRDRRVDERLYDQHGFSDGRRRREDDRTGHDAEGRLS